MNFCGVRATYGMLQQLSNIGTKRQGRKTCVPGVGESLLVVQREGDGTTFIVVDRRKWPGNNLAYQPV